MLGYLEQSVTTAIIDSLSAIGTIKPKFPFLSSTNSAIYYVALYLKGKNCEFTTLMKVVVKETHLI